MENVIRFGRELNSVPVAVVVDLLLLARRHLRAAERWCEGKGNPNYMAKIERQICALLAPYGISAKFGGDPRGFTVSVMLPDGQVIPVPLS